MTRAELRRRHLHWFCIITLILAVLFIWADILTDLRAYQNADDDVVMKSFCARLSSEASRGTCAKLLRDCNYKSNYYTQEHAGQVLASMTEGRAISYKVSEDDDSVYEIYADEDLIAYTKLDISGDFGLLHLPTYSVVSIKGTKSASYAVKSPSNTYIGDTSLQNLKPVEASLIFDEIGLLSQSTSDIQIPEYLVYHVDELFAIPHLNAKGAASYYYPMTEKDSGLYLVADYPEYSMDGEMSEKVMTFAEDYASYIFGNTDWEFLKGSIHSTGILFTALEQKVSSRPEKPAEFSVENIIIEDYYSWTSSLLTTRVKYSCKMKGTDDQEKTEDLDLKLFYFKDPGDGEWRVCEIIDNKTLTRVSSSADLSAEAALAAAAESSNEVTSDEKKN